MKLVIFGATGTVGRHLVNKALADGHRVTAFTRQADAFAGQEGLSVIAGSVFDPAAVSAAVKDQDAVIIALGNGRKGGVRAEGTATIIAAMKEHGVKRLICQSTLGVGDSAGNLNFFWKRIMFGLLLRPAFVDHVQQEELVRHSGLEWTIVRPAAFTDGPETGRYAHGFAATERGLTLKISRADVAHFILKLVRTDPYRRQAVGLSY